MNSKTEVKVLFGISTLVGFILAGCIMIAIFSCSKDEPQEVIVEEINPTNVRIMSPEDELNAAIQFRSKYVNGRSGLLLNIIDRERLVADNYLFAGLQDYQNRQIVFNKDSIINFRLSRVNAETVSIGSGPNNIYGVFLFTIDYKNPGVRDFQDIVYTQDIPKKETATFLPTGENYGVGINHQLTFIRTTRSMKYFDGVYKKYKTKFYYNVFGFGVSYNDFIPGNLQNSNIFRFLN